MTIVYQFLRAMKTSHLGLPAHIVACLSMHDMWTRDWSGLPLGHVAQCCKIFGLGTL